MRLKIIITLKKRVKLFSFMYKNKVVKTVETLKRDKSSYLISVTPNTANHKTMGRVVSTQNV